MSTPFPGMDPYLERPDLWPDLHSRLIVRLADDLAPRLRPHYYVSVEERTYLATTGDAAFIGTPDVAAVRPNLHETAAAYPEDAATPTIVTVEVPLPEQIRETFLEVRAVADARVITLLELLSPTNKRAGEGRAHYLRKRLQVLGSLTHLVEIDLLRAGEPLPMHGGTYQGDYRILVSRAATRPRAELRPFSLRQPIPAFQLPLQPGDTEPLVELNPLLHDLYDRAGYDLRIDYRAAPDPPLAEANAAWADELLREARLR